MIRRLQSPECHFRSKQRHETSTLWILSLLKKEKSITLVVGNGVCHFLRVRRNCLQSD